jgi:hypothetical protein
LAKKTQSKYRSTLEARLVPPLEKIGAVYEPGPLEYSKADGRYTLDTALPNGVALEFKGWFKPADRTKLLAVKARHPALDLRLVFEESNNRLTKGSKTTYGAWATKHGFRWANNHVPLEWIREPLNAASKAIIDAAIARRVSK